MHEGDAVCSFLVIGCERLSLSNLGWGTLRSERATDHVATSLAVRPAFALLTGCIEALTCLIQMHEIVSEMGEVGIL
eukprot:588036-Prymnesium_polylepis.1